MHSNYLLSLLFSASITMVRSEPKSVFAHFMVGNAASMTSTEWESDIHEAQKAHIDGFALNIGPQDGYTDQVLQRAYGAAEVIGNFSLFLSFDYASAGPWPADRVITTINMFKSSPAQFHYQGRPLVSTFEGAENAGDWSNIKTATGCAIIPNWTSLGPSGIASHLDTIDGAFSWDAWALGATDKTANSDMEWKNSLAGKPYMMPVAPWFYTNLPQWDKNWLWRGDNLWHDRWQQVMEMQPSLVQIISWNDYGETHYIGPVYEAGIPQGASRYVSNCPHDAWRVLLPQYIAAYKAGKLTGIASPLTPATPRQYRRNVGRSVEEKLVFWYKLNPSTAGSANGTTGNNPAMGQPVVAPGQVSQDQVFVTASVGAPSDVRVQIGDGAPSIFQASAPGIKHYSVPFNGQTGPVKFAIVRNDQDVVTAIGQAITNECEDGNVNWNAYVGSSGDDRKKSQDKLA